MEDEDERAREGSLNFAGAGIWLMPCKREREGGEREREREREGENERPSASLARLSFRAPASAAFLETVHNPCKQSEPTGRRVGTYTEEGEVACERGDRFKQDYQTIKRISTLPGISFPPLVLCAEHPRGNSERYSSAR